MWQARIQDAWERVGAARWAGGAFFWNAGSIVALMTQGVRWKARAGKAGNQITPREQPLQPALRKERRGLRCGVFIHTPHARVRTGGSSEGPRISRRREAAKFRAGVARAFRLERLVGDMDFRAGRERDAGLARTETREVVRIRKRGRLERKWAMPGAASLTIVGPNVS